MTELEYVVSNFESYLRHDINSSFFGRDIEEMKNVLKFHEDVAYIKKLNQFLRLCNLVAQKMSYAYDLYEEIPLGKLHSDGVFEEDDRIKGIVTKFIEHTDISEDDLAYIIQAYSDKSVVVGIQVPPRKPNEIIDCDDSTDFV